MRKRFVFSTQTPGICSVLTVSSLILILALLRIICARFWPDLPNFSPTTALAFCGGLFLPGFAAWIVPLGALFVSDLVLNTMFQYPLISLEQLGAWVGMLGIVGLGKWIASFPSFSLLRFVGALFGSNLIFYLITNTVSWISNPAYPRGLSGLWISLTVGLPGFPPTWVFFRNSLISDFLFGGLLLCVWVFAQMKYRANKEIPSTI